MWLTALLRREGYLDRGEVTTVRSLPSDSTITATITRLEPEYSEEAAESAPSRLFLKIARPSQYDSRLLPWLGKNEVEFYTVIARAMSHIPVVRCYDAAYVSETGAWHLLLDDLSETHFQTEWPLPPTRRHCEQMIDWLARFHGFWWRHPRLGEDIGELPSEKADDDTVSNIERRFSGFADFLDRLSQPRRRSYEEAITGLPRLLKRQREGVGVTSNYTLIHRDAHCWQFLYPHDSDRFPVYLIDWQSWGIGSGTGELVYTIAVHWYPERRRLMEMDLVKRYHQGLLESGVEGYNWDDCWTDYRAAVITNGLFVPVRQWSSNIGPQVWWPHLERAMAAFDDLSCAELLDR